MAKKIYTIPLQKTLEATKNYKSDIFKLTQDRNFLEFNKLFGKSYYYIELEKFIHFFKIDKDISYALKTMENFNSKVFINDEVALRLNFSQYNLEVSNITQKDFFYGYMNLLRVNNEDLFSTLLQKLFIHYHSAFKNNSDIQINFKDIVTSLAKTRNITLKESFGENGDKSYFILFANTQEAVKKEGKSIKTLRKQCYKEYFYHLIDS